MTKRLYAEISKREELPDGTVKVWGYASTPDEDSDGEIITPEAMKAALPEYLKFGAVREMHGANAAGTAIEAEVQEDGRTWFGAHIVDSEAVKKVRANVYKGFSIGGKITGRDAVKKSTITGIKLVEVSLVDRPANPEAVFTMFKAEMEEVLDKPAPVKAVPAEGASEADIEKKAIAELAALVKSGEMTASEILRRVKACSCDEDSEAEASEDAAKEASASGGDLGKVEALYKAEIELLEKSAEEALLKLSEVQVEKENLAKRVAVLEALPEPARIRLMAIGKAEDGVGHEPLVAPVRKADGSIDEVATEIKKIQRLSGKKIWG